MIRAEGMIPRRFIAYGALLASSVSIGLAQDGPKEPKLWPDTAGTVVDIQKPTTVVVEQCGHFSTGERLSYPPNGCVEVGVRVSAAELAKYAVGTQVQPRELEIQ
jgi:hypothetical protein